MRGWIAFSSILPLSKTFQAQGVREVVDGVQQLTMNPDVSASVRCKSYCMPARVVAEKVDCRSDAEVYPQVRVGGSEAGDYRKG